MNNKDMNALEAKSNPFQHVPKKIDKYYVTVADHKCGFIMKMVVVNSIPYEYTLEHAIGECREYKRQNIFASYVPVVNV